MEIDKVIRIYGNRNKIVTVEYAPVTHAHWYQVPNTDNCACSNCMTSELAANTVMYDFCPHCGAVMDEVMDND